MLKSPLLTGMLIAGTVCASPAVAQDNTSQPSASAEPDLDALARRIEAAKAEATRKEQADKAAAEQRKAEQARAAEAARQAAAKQQATLVVKADADCQLTVNGVGWGRLAANQTQSIKVSPGEQLIECVATDSTGANTQASKTVTAGAQAVVVLSLTAVIAAKHHEAQQRAAAEIAARDPGNAGFVDLGGGILKDTKTGLEWTQNDNGSDIDWNGARRYCSARGGSWRLPSVAELLAIYDADVPTPKVCSQFSGRSFDCKVSKLFNLTGAWFWSGEASDSSLAFYVNLVGGLRNSYPIGYPIHERALCVRRN